MSQIVPDETIATYIQRLRQGDYHAGSHVLPWILAKKKEPRNYGTTTRELTEPLRRLIGEWRQHEFKGYETRLLSLIYYFGIPYVRLGLSADEVNELTDIEAMRDSRSAQLMFASPDWFGRYWAYARLAERLDYGLTTYHKLGVTSELFATTYVLITRQVAKAAAERDPRAVEIFYRETSRTSLEDGTVPTLTAQSLEMSEENFQALVAQVEEQKKLDSLG